MAESDDAGASWDEHASGWDDHPAVVAYANAAFASLVGVTELAGKRVLDFGCGTGLLTERLAPQVAEVIAVDASAEMVKVLAAKALANVRFTVAEWTAETIGADPLAAEPFDIVVCSSVCAFLPDYPAAVAMLAERLVPGGLFVQWDWELDPEADEPFGLTREAIRAALENAGLTVVSVDTGFEAAVQDMVMRPVMGVGRNPVG